MPDDSAASNYARVAEESYQPVAETTDSALKRGYWETAIGLQQVDGLEPSDYLRKLAAQNVAGELSYAEVHKELHGYYSSSRSSDVDTGLSSSEEPSSAAAKADAHGTQEADIVSARIAELLDTFPFWFAADTLETLHEHLFAGLYENAGRFRTYDIMKAEPILGGKSVTYAAHGLITRLLRRFFDDEEARSFSYAHPLQGEQLATFARFTADVWHVHPFDEGNTRTTAVFTILYLRSLGYEVDNALFEKHSRYYRDALVRASYFNIRLGVERTDSFLRDFYDNLLNRTTHPLDPQKLAVEPLLPKT
jgi:fido (protein-threonine AMPylation protein)